MKLLLALLLFPTLVLAEDYPLTDDSKPQDGVPKGEIIQFTLGESKVFPGTTRQVSVYIPKQYDAAKPACVWVNQDGIQNEAPVVFDNLIAKKEIPVTIGVFVTPGVVKALDGNVALDRFNRSFEYDGLGDAYARFVLEELLPAVEQQKAGDGRAISLSKSGNDRCIAGASSGAICAFTAAWERPDAFRRVFSSIGTYVSLRGGDTYPGIIRKLEPKPLRIFLQEGEADQNIWAGDWWMANQSMERALTFAGYEVNHAWGKGGHDHKHSTAIFPEVVRWIWKDWPAEPKAGTGSPQLQSILIPGENWELVWEGGKFTEGPACNAKGEVFFNDIPNSKTYKVGLDGNTTEIFSDTKNGDGEAFGPDGRHYMIAAAAKQVVTYDDKGAVTVVADGIHGNDIVVLHNGSVYLTEPGWDGKSPSKIWHLTSKGEKTVVDTGIKFSNGIAASADQSLLYVADTKSHWVYSYQIQPDGTLKHKQRYYHLHVHDSADDSGADGMEVDADGRLYVATRLGVQVCDQIGRVTCIIPTPNGKLSNMVLAGERFDTLFATCNEKVYKRKLKVKGAPSFAPPVKPVPPRL